MREREEIEMSIEDVLAENASAAATSVMVQGAILEVLLDIRELLSPPAKEKDI